MLILANIFAAVAAIFSLLAFLRVNRAHSRNDITLEQISELHRVEGERMRQLGDEQGRNLRAELTESLRGFQESSLRGFKDLGDTLNTQVKEFGATLDKGIKIIDERSSLIGEKLDKDMAKMAEEANNNRENLRNIIETKLSDAVKNQTSNHKELREEMTGNFRTLGASNAQTLTQIGENQKERLEGVAKALGTLSEKHERAQQELKLAVENRLDILRTENTTKLDEMRKTVDEKLQSTLETRLGESFTRVVEHLERVHKGIGEMQSLATGVGDLKKILSNVRVRGTFGEVQLAMLLEQFLSPEQYIKNAQIKPDSLERVEFAIKFPGRDVEGEVLLPVDAKFPHEDYDRLMVATEAGDIDAMNIASKELEKTIKLCAKTIKEKYISVPSTTDFAILFMPTESLFAEVLRRPGLFEQIQREYNVTLAGPTTFIALLNSLQMGFRSLAIEKRSSEVWQILGAVKNEFGNYNTVVDKLSRQLETAVKSVGQLGTRTRVMNRKLREVEVLTDSSTQVLLGPALVESDDVEPLETDAA